ncbi:4'-phosphopantetheinyl transferase family protein [Acidimangrovimonas sediminis]|uniref:4'-phosphopantetheinyl transferase family protein n=1 Tax=Acidimangrovimonas sediminis TaxID=2056283 RepID=UPI000C7FE285|nr:4'-phosphopantetheinyl transferase superfamily protein [Acidimangrovimonas sediminis]
MIRALPGDRARAAAQGAAVGVDLWFWRLDPAAPAGPLSADEEARAARFVRAPDAMAFRAARAGLRRVLAGYLGSDPAALTFHYGPQGKPSLPGGPAFNLSHAGGWAALAVCDADLPLGLDIEAHRAVEPEVAERFFAPAEAAALRGLRGPARETAFFRLWTRKEALVKAVGQGLSLPLDSFAVTVDAAARLLRLDHDDAAAWTLTDLAPGAGLQGALALRTAGRPVRLCLRAGTLPLTAAN